MTLNQLIKSLKATVGGNPFVNSLYVGEVSEWTDLNNLVYTNALIVIGEVTPLGAEYEVSFTLYISDLLEEGGLNRVEVFSDTLQIAQDLAASLDDETLNPSFVFSLTQALEFFDDVRGNDNADTVAGVVMRFTLRTAYQKQCASLDLERAESGIQTEEGFYLFTEAGEIVEKE